MAVTAARRAFVIERQEYVCWWCDAGFVDVYAIHHRRLRSQGGLDLPDNLVAVHHRCHNGNTDSIHFNVEESTRLGFIVPSGYDPGDWPLTRRDGAVVLLTETWYRTLVEPLPW